MGGSQVPESEKRHSAGLWLHKDQAGNSNLPGFLHYLSINLSIYLSIYLFHYDPHFLLFNPANEAASPFHQDRSEILRVNNPPSRRCRPRRRQSSAVPNAPEDVPDLGAFGVRADLRDRPTTYSTQYVSMYII